MAKGEIGYQIFANKYDLLRCEQTLNISLDHKTDAISCYVSYVRITDIYQQYKRQYDHKTNKVDTSIFTMPHIKYIII